MQQQLQQQQQQPFVAPPVGMMPCSSDDFSSLFNEHVEDASGAAATSHCQQALLQRERQELSSIAAQQQQAFDPFQLQGDERTWHLSDWAWDPFSVAAAPNAAVSDPSANKRPRGGDMLPCASSSSLRAQAVPSQQQQQQQPCCNQTSGSVGMPCSFHLPKPFSTQAVIASSLLPSHSSGLHHRAASVGGHPGSHATLVPTDTHADAAWGAPDMGVASAHACGFTGMLDGTLSHPVVPEWQQLQGHEGQAPLEKQHGEGPPLVWLQQQEQQQHGEGPPLAWLQQQEQQQHGEGPPLAWQQHQEQQQQQQQHGEGPPLAWLQQQEQQQQQVKQQGHGWSHQQGQGGQAGHCNLPGRPLRPPLPQQPLQHLVQQPLQHLVQQPLQHLVQQPLQHLLQQRNPSGVSASCQLHAANPGFTLGGKDIGVKQQQQQLDGYDSVGAGLGVDFDDDDEVALFGTEDALAMFPSSAGRGAAGGGGRAATPARKCTPVELAAALAKGVVSINEEAVLEDAEKMVCQVPGCGKDLSGLKDYHQRYRICEVHIKLPQVIKEASLQRFCQQCGRFHELNAFEGARKSCRDQLGKHNARRRRRAQVEQQKAKQQLQLQQQQQPRAGELLSPCIAAGSDGGDGDRGGGGAQGGQGGGPSRAGSTGGGLTAAADIPRLLSALMRNPQQLQALRLLLGMPTNSALPPLRPYTPEPAALGPGAVAPPTAAATPDGPTSSGCGAAGYGPASYTVARDPASYNLAREVVEGRGAFAPSYSSEHCSLRLSMKLFNRTPADLPPDLKQQVTSWLSSAPASVEGYIRPGCVYLTMQLLVTQEAYHQAAAAGLPALLQHLLHDTGCQFWWTGVYTVQLLDQLAVLEAGQLSTLVDYSVESNASAAAGKACGSRSGYAFGPQKSRLGSDCATKFGGRPACSASCSAMLVGPCVRGPSPPCCASRQQQAPAILGMSALGVLGSGTGSGSGLVIYGRGLDTPGLELICRFQGQQVRCTMSVSQAGTEAAITGLLLIPPNTQGGGRSSGCGVAMIECCVGAYASQARPLLILDDPDLLAEVQQLACLVHGPAPGRATAGSGASGCPALPSGGSEGLRASCQVSAEEADALLVDLGLVLHHSQVVSAHGMAPRALHHKALSLLALACDMGWACLAARLLPLLTRYEAAEVTRCQSATFVAEQASDRSGGGAPHSTAGLHEGAAWASGAPSSSSSPAAAYSRQESKRSSPGCGQANPDGAATGGGLSLLHRAVRSGSLPLVACLLQYSRRAAAAAAGPAAAAHGSRGGAGYHGTAEASAAAAAASAASLSSWWRWCRADAGGPGGLTPLHLAALVGDARVAVMLLVYCPPSAFTRLVAEDGVTPFHLAFQMGHFDVPALMRALHCSQVGKAGDYNTAAGSRHKKQRLTLAAGAGQLLNSGSSNAHGVSAKRRGKLCRAKAGLQSETGCVEDVMDIELGPNAAVDTAMAPLAPGSGPGRKSFDTDLDPCEHCHSTVPPLLLDVTASCSDCGQARPCFAYSDDEAASDHTELRLPPDLTPPSFNRDDDVSSSCSLHPLPATAAWGRERVQRLRSGQAAASTLAGRQWPSSGEMPPASSLEGQRRCSKQAAAVAAMATALSISGHQEMQRLEPGGGARVTGSRGGRGARRGDESQSCAHSHGNVYSVTAMCQSCHSNRLLEVLA